ncbi:enoyl-CoA hydratase/isomerase family protein [Cognatishimia activa]|uniref:enoyl-CoA hydratase/isomerase family protein n=1 Tax=Cognatishimia activa TaxID=1715691 RepID=UPI00223234B7|nr:enoyl-CoA hydratase/isomerase family protein [Cognatishimia activa]UZD91278.1 enoyl-CoA hydratase/isomerase family protein [Cognatishimia activa]
MEAPVFKTLLVEVREEVALVTLNRPWVLNAISTQCNREIISAIEWAEDNDEVKAVIFNGAGRAFCAGADVKEIREFKKESIRRYIELDFRTKNAVAECRKPTIAAIHSHCAGGGFELALACDIRFASEDALMSLPEVRLGAMPGSGGLQRLAPIVGLGVAKEMAFTGKPVTAERAERIGLVNRVTTAEVLEAEAFEFAKELTQINPIAIRCAKVALEPDPLPTRGQVGVFHQLFSTVIRDDPWYSNQTKKFGA